MSESDVSSPPKPLLRREIPVPVLVVGAAIVLVGTAAYVAATAWNKKTLWNVPRHAAAPEGLHALKLEMTRRELAEYLEAEGVTWPSIRSPGMSPTSWVGQTDVLLGGHSTPEVDFLFSDGAGWDYDNRPEQAAAVVDAAGLVGPLDPSAKLVGIRWRFAISNALRRNDDFIPPDVLSVLGKPHSRTADITGTGVIYRWEWPGFDADYFTYGATLTMSSVEPEA